MRTMLLMTTMLLGLAAPAFAQGGSTSATQTPPSPNASTSEPQATGSLPPGAATATGTRPGDAVGGRGASPDRGMSGMRPMRGQQQDTMSQDGDRPMPMTRPGRMARTQPGAATDDGGARGDYDGGRGVPMSARSSNSTASNTRSEIAPRLPAPDAGGNTPEAFLAAAQRALASGRTGQAQEALERAETRLLTRSTEASAANTADSSPMVAQIGEARRALGRRDTVAARQAINSAMSAGSGSSMPMSSGGSRPMGSGSSMPMGSDSSMPMGSGTSGPAMGGPAMGGSSGRMMR